MPVAASAAETACVFPQPGGPYSSTPVRSRSGALPLSASSGAVGSVQLHAMRARKTECPTHGCLWCECQLQGCGPKHTSVKQGLWLQLQATPASLWPASAAQAEHQKPALDQGAPRTEAGKARGQRQRLAQRGHRVRQAAHVVPAARARRGAGVRARHAPAGRRCKAVPRGRQIGRADMQHTWRVAPRPQLAYFATWGSPCTAMRTVRFWCGNQHSTGAALQLKCCNIMCAWPCMRWSGGVHRPR